MSKKRNAYKEFFGIREEKYSDQDVQNVKAAAAAYKEIAAAAKEMAAEGLTESELEEAQLINNITDYKGGVQYMLRDAAMAENVANEIKQFAAKKKIYIVKHTQSRSGKGGYFYFRLGEDPAKESQQLQGYLSQKPEIKYFRFKVMPDRQPRQTRNI
jgi:hypothetical protein